MILGSFIIMMSDFWSSSNKGMITEIENKIPEMAEIRKTDDDAAIRLNSHRCNLCCYRWYHSEGSEV